MKHLFLDLEDTVITPVIDGWHLFEIINQDKIQTVINRFEPNFIDIFSFAIHDDFQLAQFNKFTRPVIESAFNVKLNIVPTVDRDIKNACCDVLNITPSQVEFDDVSTFWSKQESFRLFCRHLFRKTFNQTHQTTEVFFLDDAVEHEDFCFPLLQLRGWIRNIDLL